MNQPNNLPVASGMDISLEEMNRLATTIYNSNLFPSLKNPAQAFTLMLTCQSEGIHPIQAMRRYDIVDGKPALKAGTMLADFKKLGGKYTLKQHTDKICEIEMELDGSKIISTWTIEEAHKAGLLSKTVWQKYAKAMLFARAVSAGIRIIAPEVNLGIYTPEEIKDMDSEPAPATVEAEIETDYTQAIAECESIEQFRFLENAAKTAANLAEDEKFKALQFVAKEYVQLEEIIFNDIDAANDLESINSFIDSIDNYTHVWNSKANTARALKRKAIEMGFELDKETRKYIEPAGDPGERQGAPETADPGPESDAPAPGPQDMPPEESPAEPAPESEPAAKDPADDENKVAKTAQATLQRKFNKLCKAAIADPSMENQKAVDDFWQANEAIRTQKNSNKLLEVQKAISDKVDK